MLRAETSICFERVGLGLPVFEKGAKSVEELGKLYFNTWAPKCNMWFCGMNPAGQGGGTCSVDRPCGCSAAHGT